MREYFKIHQKNSGCLRPPGLRQPCSSPPAFFSGSWKDPHSGHFRLRGGKGLPMTLETSENSELQQPGAGLSPGRAGPCRAVPSCCTLQPVTAASPWRHTCACCSPEEQSDTSGFPSSISTCLPYCLSSAGGRFVHPCSHRWGTAQLSAHPARGQECYLLWSSAQRLLGTRGNSTADFSK